MPRLTNRRFRLSSDILGACAAMLTLAAGSTLALAQARPERGPRIDDSKISLRSGDIDTSIATVGLSELVRDARTGVSKRSLIQLDGPMTEPRAAMLEEAGVRIGQFLPPNAFVADLSDADEARVARLGFIRWQSRYEREWRLDPEIGQRAYTTDERRELIRQGDTPVVVHVFEGEDPAAVAGAIAAIPGAVVHSVDNADGVATVSATMAFNDTVLLADIPEVQFVEDAPENTERSNSNDRWIIQTNVLNMTPVYTNGITGVGQIIGVIDSALDINHCSFRDSVNNTPGASHRKVHAYNTTPGAVSHGTHVSGTTAGDNGVNDDTRGVAYGARIVYNSIPSPQDEANITSRLSLHYGQGARIHTNSWGDDGTTAYTGQCRGIDAHTYANEDSLVLFAVTNTSTLKTPENAKNCLAVGATQGAGAQDNFCSGGAGPTNDGRRKPEAFAPGCSTLSSQAGSACSTVPLTGTSMACPAVAGAATLVRDYFARGYYPNGSANASDAINPSAALVKAAVINSCSDMTGITGYPSNQEGWGRVTIDNTLYFAGDTRNLFARDVRNADGFTTGGTYEQGINVVSSTQPFEVTLVWTDPPAAANANPAYINDLDLEIVGPGGELFLGNNFSGGQSAQGGAADFRNNVETVLINVPAEGAYTIRVRATAVNVGTQGYALVASGILTVGPRPLSVGVAGAPTVIFPGNVSTFTVNINPGDDTLVGGSPMVHYRDTAVAAYAAAPLTLISGTTYQADLPGFFCGDSPQFYVSAAGVTTGTVTSPFNGSSNPLSALVGESVIALDDPIEAPTGWTVGAAGDTATTGIWEQVDPIATLYQPEDDHTVAGTQCWITGQHTVGQSAGFNDVDGGATTLLSPVLDLTSYSNPTITYWRWFVGTAPSDTFTVSVSSNAGLNWTPVETVVGGSAGWTQFSFQPGSLVPVSNQMRLRFVANDGGTGSFVEAGIDDLLIDAFQCMNPPPSCQGDADGNGMVDFGDVTAVLSNYGGTPPVGDANFDGSIDFKDITHVLANFGVDCGQRMLPPPPSASAKKLSVE